MADTADSLRRLPSIDRLLKEQAAVQLAEQYPRDLVVQTLRETLDDIRSEIRAGAPLPDIKALLEAAKQRLASAFRPSLRPVINATGVIVHTNLGRAPLSEEALRAVQMVSGCYSNLEYRLDEGLRGSRHEHVTELLRRISGAEDAMVVNNNAAAILLTLSALAQGREVIISRGQAVEIGGGFRIPDVLLQSGAKLVEVGTTNRTYIRDYEEAVTENTALLLHVHPSNFRVEGFVHSTSIDELVSLGREKKVPVVDDLGSGSFIDSARYGLQHEPMVQERIDSGVDLVCFSGDKLLGGPQAGLIVGKTRYLEQLRRHPLARAIRVDKMTIAALSATLRHYLLGDAERKIPVWQMIALPLEKIDTRASSLVRRLRRGGLEAKLVPGLSTVGGGSLPGETLPTRLIAIASGSGGIAPMELATRLRRMDPPLVARLERSLLLVDLRTVRPEDDRVVGDHLLAVGTS